MVLINKNSKNSKEFQMKYVVGELEGLRKVLAYLYDGEQEAFNALYFIKSNYKQWPQILMWLKNNKIKGKKLVELMQNESPSGRGYHLGVTKIISMMEGMKHNERSIKINELL